jgi:hypothetical protein
MALTQSVGTCVPTQSVGTRRPERGNEVAVRWETEGEPWYPGLGQSEAKCLHVTKLTKLFAVSFV